MFEIIKLKRGETARLSPKNIVFGRVNLMQARKLLNPQEYTMIQRIFNEISTHKEKKTLTNFEEYAKWAMRIIAHFDIVAPHYLYSGDNYYRDTANKKEEQEKAHYRRIAKEYLATHQYRFIGDVNWDRMIDEFYSKFIGL